MLAQVEVNYVKSCDQNTIFDEKILFAVGEGDPIAFLNLYEKTKTIVFTYVFSLLRNKEDAEDAMQETYLKIRSAAHLYCAKGKPMAWIFTIARNVCLMKFREDKREINYLLEAQKNYSENLLVDNLEDKLVLQEAFKVLSEQECEIILLHAVTGFKHKEISSLLNIPLSTVLSKYNRGLKKLQKNLEGKL